MNEKSELQVELESLPTLKPEIRGPAALGEIEISYRTEVGAITFVMAKDGEVFAFADVGGVWTRGCWQAMADHSKHLEANASLIRLLAEMAK